MSTSVNTHNIPSTYAAQPGYQPVSTNEFGAPQAPPAYTPTPGQAYPPPQGGYAPAPMYHPQQHGGYVSQQSSSNVVVVQQQAAVLPVITRPEGYQPEAGQAALIFAMIVTITVLLCGCWWSFICSIPGIVFASSATSAGIRGDREEVRRNNNFSYGCTVAAIVSTVAGLGVTFGVVFGVWYHPCRYYYSYC